MTVSAVSNLQDLRWSLLDLRVHGLHGCAHHGLHDHHRGHRGRHHRGHRGRHHRGHHPSQGRIVCVLRTRHGSPKHPLHPSKGLLLHTDLR